MVLSIVPKFMTKKKGRRTDSRKVYDEQSSVWRRDFYESGVLGSILLLMVFIVCASFVLSCGESNSGTVKMLCWPRLRTFSIIGSFVFVLSLALGLYVAINEPRIIQSHLRGIHLLLMLLIMIVLVRVGVLHRWSPYLAVVPAMLTGITITITYNQRFALGVGSFLVLVSVLVMADMSDSLRQGMGVMLCSGGGMAIAVLLLRKIRSFTGLIEVCLISGVVIFVLIFMSGLWQGIGLLEILKNCLYGSLGAVSVGFIMQGLLPVIERLFHTATDITLLTYGEVTKPLLKRLALEAPGTFNHSWQIGMLSEAAAEAVGANGLLCRVGSYYHDVGKLNKPRYFVENQEENFNQHKELSPTMSRMIIVGHVKDGLELMQEYKIPKVLHQFVATHHGTTLVEYFYHEATKTESETDKKAMEVEFRYPGPKPFSVEAAVVMLADAVEGATRAMQEPTPSRIELLVHNLAIKRLQDGQFDSCDLTMRQLHIMEQSLVKSLCAMYHGRITYPKTAKPVRSYRSDTGKKDG
jgi:putative nucleotidyltransferase with HDIG domain